MSNTLLTENNKKNESVILIIDQGTSSTKAFLFDRNLDLLFTEKICHQIHRPDSGWVETDPQIILESCQSLINSLLNVCQDRSLNPAGLGMAFQRSTFLFWNKFTGRPLTPAMSWQDTRAKSLISRFEEYGHTIHRTTGIPLTSHFGGPKYLFSILNNSDLKSQVESGKVLFGPISSFVTHRLTGKALIDESIAGRTLFLNLETMRWDPHLLELFHVPPHSLPRLVTTCGNLGTLQIRSFTIPLLCIIGDQQASLVGQGRLNIGDVAMNFGTSGSVLVYSGISPKIVPSLLCNVLYSFKKKRHFIVEGTINSVGSLFRWLEEYLDIPHSQMNWENRCSQQTGGILVPGINGISSPYWTGEFDTTLLGFSSSSNPNEIVRSGMESIGFLVNDIWEIIQNEKIANRDSITVSGGHSKPLLLQFIADLLNTPIWNSAHRDMTALGVTKLIAKQIWDRPIKKRPIPKEDEFVPMMSEEKRKRKISLWHDALRQLSIVKE